MIPLFNEEDNIRLLHTRLTAAMEALKDSCDHELIFVDDHSTDSTFAILRSLAEADPRVCVIRLSRNFRHQKAVFTGYAAARGDAAVQLDGDLQDPPELIPEFVRLWRDGSDVVYGIRRTRQEGRLITWMRSNFYRLVDRLSEDRLPRDAGDFRLVSRRVLDELRHVRDNHIYLRGLIATLGFRQTGVPYDRDARVHGSSKFSWFRLGGLALDGVIGHSVLPLRIATYVGLAMAVVTFFAIAVYMIGRLFYFPDWPPGFATTTVLQLLALSLNALFFGIIGEYVGRIYKQVRQRPLTVVERTVNIAPPDWTERT